MSDSTDVQWLIGEFSARARAGLAWPTEGGLAEMIKALSRLESMSNLPIHLGQTEKGEAFTLPLTALTKHLLALGSTGSGKTVLCKSVIEEAIRYNLPCIAVDLQGDLLSLAIQSGMVPPGAVPPSEVTRQKYAERLDCKVWTPGSSLGIPLSFAPDMLVPDDISPEDRIHAFNAVAVALASILGDMKEATVKGLHIILEYADQQQLICDSLEWVARFLADPPVTLAERLESLLPGRDRKKLLKSLDAKRAGVGRLLYDFGQPIDVPQLFGLRYPGPAWENRARLSIVYLAHLGEAQQQTFLSLLFSSMYRWMLRQDGGMSGLLYIDEIAPFCPPVKQPPAKDGLMLLLRQARKYGLSTVLATQTPGDVDYRALGQFGTLALGRIIGNTAEGKVERLIRSYPNIDSDAIMDRVRAASGGQFVMMNSDHLSAPTPIQARWLVTEHRLVARESVGDFVSAEDREILG